MSVNVADVGASSTARVHYPWTHEDGGEVKDGTFTANVRRHGVVLITLAR
jgi:hypothetical protein